MRARQTGLIALVAFTASCHQADEPTAPSARSAKAGSGTPAVTSVVPDSSERGITLDLTVNGSGFDQGSVVGFERQGVPATKLTTNSTSFVTPKKLIANVTIATDADTGAYDVAVTTSSGRKGVGIELLTIIYQLDELGMLGGTWSRANSINDQGEVVGESCTQDCRGHAFYWNQDAGLVDLGTLQGYTRSAASVITSRGQVFGSVKCPSVDPECGGATQRAAVRWDRVGGTWTITPVAGCTLFNLEKFVINSNEQCVRASSTSVSPATLSIQTLSGGAVVSEEFLPSLYPGGTNSASSINDAGMVAGAAHKPAQDGTADAVVWYRNATGDWVALRLGFPGSDYAGSALDISEPDAAGHVWVSGRSAGGSRTRGYRAVRWTLEPDGTGGWRVATTQTLEQRKGESDAWGRSVNADGDVVGHSISPSYRPVKWPVGDGVETLPTPSGGASGYANDINADGWIVGAVYDAQNECDRGAIWRLR